MLLILILSIYTGFITFLLGLALIYVILIIASSISIFIIYLIGKKLKILEKYSGKKLLHALIWKDNANFVEKELLLLSIEKCEISYDDFYKIENSDLFKKYVSEIINRYTQKVPVEVNNPLCTYYQIELLNRGLMSEIELKSLYNEITKKYEKDKSQESIDEFLITLKNKFYTYLSSNPQYINPVILQYISLYDEYIKINKNENNQSNESNQSVENKLEINNKEDLDKLILKDPNKELPKLTPPELDQLIRMIIKKKLMLVIPFYTITFAKFKIIDDEDKTLLNTKEEKIKEEQEAIIITPISFENTFTFNEIQTVIDDIFISILYTLGIFEYFGEVSFFDYKIPILFTSFAPGLVGTQAVKIADMLKQIMGDVRVTTYLTLMKKIEESQIMYEQKLAIIEESRNAWIDYVTSIKQLVASDYNLKNKKNKKAKKTEITKDIIEEISDEQQQPQLKTKKIFTILSIIGILILYIFIFSFLLK